MHVSSCTLESGLNLPVNQAEPHLISTSAITVSMSVHRLSLDDGVLEQLRLLQELNCEGQPTAFAFVVSYRQILSCVNGFLQYKAK